MERSSPTITVDIDSDSFDELAEHINVPKLKQRCFKETVQEAAKEFQEERAAPKVGAIQKEITSLAKAIAKVLNKPTQKKGKPTQKKEDTLMWLAACKKLRPRLDKLAPEAIDYLLRHRPPHDRSNPPWKSNEFDREGLEDLYARCCVNARVKDKNGNLLSKPDVKYGPVKKPGRPKDYAKMMLAIRMGAAFHTAKGTYPERANIVLMTDYVLEKLGEPAKQDRDYQDTHMAREYLRLLKELHDAVPPSRAPAKSKRHFEGG